MRMVLETIGKQVLHFLGLGPLSPTQPSTHSPTVSPTIQLALRQQAAVHVIYANKSATGYILRVDHTRHQLLLNEWGRPMTTIIPLHQIQRLSLLPKTH